MARVKARFNKDNVVGVKFKVGLSEYIVEQHLMNPSKVNLMSLDGKKYPSMNWWSKEAVAANLNCNSWEVIEEPELYSIF